MFGPNPEIYAKLYSQLILTDSDRHSLTAKRGLAADTTKILGFRSARPENGAVIEKLVDEYGYGACFSCGLINQKYKPAWQFTKNGLIIIPYFNVKGELIFFKSHKFGNLDELGIVPYSEWLAAYYWLKNQYNDTLVVCESEFKAAAMWQMGWPAIGVGGVNAITGIYFPRLTTFFFDLFKYHQLKFKKIIVLFDTEIQDDPELASYKQDYQRRYAQHIYAYVMAIRLRDIQASIFNRPETVVDSSKAQLTEGELHKLNLQEAHDNILIATLPTSWTVDGNWTVDGKVDIDSAVAAGHTKEEFAVVLKNALRPETYRYKLDVPPQYVPWVNRRMEKALHDSAIFKHNRSYHTNVFDKKIKKAYTKELSNFIIDSKNIIIRDGSAYREVQIKSKYGDVSPSFEVTAEEMSNFKAFKTKCLSKGDFLWKGTDLEFSMVMEELFLETSGTQVFVLDFVGRDEEHKQWVFENMIIKDDGRILKPDEDGTFWDQTCGYRIKPLSEFGVLPKLSEDPINIEVVMGMFEEAWGVMGRVAFVTALASLFAEATFKAGFQGFPILMIYGEKESGKSALADALYALFGFGMHVPTKNICISSVPGIYRGMSYYSSLPMRLDEYRNDEMDMKKKDSAMRGFYNRQGDAKGKKAFGMRELPVRSTLFLIGEEKPEDPALVSRCVTIYLSKHNNNEKTANALRWIYRNEHHISNVTFQLLKQYQSKAKQFVEDVTATNASLHTIIKSDFRAQLHYSMMMAMMGLLFDKETALAKMGPLAEYFNVVMKTTDRDSLLGKFFAEVYTMFVLDESVQRFFTKSNVDHNLGYFYVSGVYALWSQFKARSGQRSGLVSEKNVQDYLRSQPYCLIPSDKVFVPAKTIRVPCIGVNINHPQLPEELRDMFHLTH